LEERLICPNNFVEPRKNALVALRGKNLLDKDSMIIE
jgi:hypothetical protein